MIIILLCVILLCSCTDGTVYSNNVIATDSIEVVAIRVNDTVLVYNDLSATDVQDSLRKKNAHGYVLVCPTQKDFLHWETRNGYGSATMHDIERLFGTNLDTIATLYYLCEKVNAMTPQGFAEFEAEITQAEKDADERYKELQCELQEDTEQHSH